jgi:purine-binding chemotaxis protein CheW
MTTPHLLPGTTAAVRPFCTFRLGESLYGLDVRLVQSVNTPPPLTPVPHAPPVVRGYANLRSQIHLVLDLKRLLGMGRTELLPETRLVLFKPLLGDPFGVLVDRAADIVHLPADRIEERRRPGPGTPGGATATEPPGVEVCLLHDDELIGGVGKLDGELLLLLDARKLLQAVEKSLAA